MALSSQTISRGTGKSYSTGGRRRRRRSRPKRVLALAAVAVLAWVGWSMFFSATGETNEAAPAGGDAVTAAPNADDADGERTTPDAAGAGLGDGFDSIAAGVSRGSRDVDPQPFSPTQPRDLTRSDSDSRTPSETRAGDDSRENSSRSDSEPPEPEPTRVAAAADREDRDREQRSSSSSNDRASRSDDQALELMAEGQALYEDDELVDARAVLNTALSSGKLSESDAQDVRDLMAQINETLIFSPRVVEGDPLVEAYEVQSGDVLERITKPYDVPWQMVARINDISDPRRIRVGQRLKMVKGPFHVVVHKRAYRLDVFVGDMYVRSFPVGLGEHDMTPTGEFIVRSGKLENPEWTNPRTGERFLPDDPENPLGGYWIGIRGTTADTEVHSGYGIHGTIEPDSIGTDASMGCIRLLPSDVSELYVMLTEEKSRVLVAD